MADFLQRVLMAYRPLYLRGLLLDGQYRFPVTDASQAQKKPAPAPTGSGLPAARAILAAAYVDFVRD